jgi:hypothetical protein
MKTLRMYGASDDLVEAEGLPGCDEFNVLIDHQQHATFLVSAENGRLHVHAVYAGSWAFAVTSATGTDYDLMPDWPIRRTFGDKCSYSETLEIDCPDDATLTPTFPRKD